MGSYADRQTQIEGKYKIDIYGGLAGRQAGRQECWWVGWQAYRRQTGGLLGRPEGRKAE
jgi:hypothetical protein